MPWTAAGVGEAAAAAEGRAAGMLGPAPAVAAGEAPAAAELGPVALVAPGVEVLAGGVGLWFTRGQ